MLDFQKLLLLLYDMTKDCYSFKHHIWIYQVVQNEYIWLLKENEVLL